MYRIGGKRLGANWKSKAGEDGTVGDRIGTAWSVEAGEARWVGEWNVAECCGAWRQEWNEASWNGGKSHGLKGRRGAVVEADSVLAR